jgi:hypothetical protein
MSAACGGRHPRLLSLSTDPDRRADRPPDPHRPVRRVGSGADPAYRAYQDVGFSGW